MKALLEIQEDADEAYNAIEGAGGGTIISTDVARHLDEKYTNEVAGELRDLKPSWDLAWRYSQDRLERELSSRNKRKTVRFMAGGWASGKTFAVNRVEKAKPDLVWDGTLEDAIWAVEMIELAAANGWKVEVSYVFRDLELALYGAIERAREVGRTVPLTKLAANHRAVQNSLLKLARIYRFKESVSFLFLHNLGTKTIQADTPTVSIKDLDNGGALHYLERHEHYYSAAAKILEADHAS